MTPSAAPGRAQASGGRRPSDTGGEAASGTPAEEFAAEVEAERARDRAQQKTKEPVSETAEVRPRDKLTVYMDPPETERMRATRRFTAAWTGHEKQTEFIEEAIARYCSYLESTYNNGVPFPTEPAKGKSHRRSAG